MLPLDEVEGLSSTSLSLLHTEVHSTRGFYTSPLLVSFASKEEELSSRLFKPWNRSVARTDSCEARKSIRMLFFE